MGRIQPLPLTLFAVLGLLAAVSSCQKSGSDEPTAIAAAPPVESNFPAAPAASPPPLTESVSTSHQAVLAPAADDAASGLSADPVTEGEAATRRASELAARERWIAAQEAELAAREAAVAPPRAPRQLEPDPAEPGESEPLILAEEGAEAPADEPLTESRAAIPSSPATAIRRTVPLTLPAGTELDVELLEAVSTEKSQVGDPVRARLVHDLEVDGTVAVPAGVRVEGSVIEVDRGRGIRGQARLVLSFDRLEPSDADPVAIHATYAAVGRNQAKKDAATIAGSAAGGAVLGRVLSKKNRTERSV
ncbi:MAG: hypothetical protein V3T81_03370, partial [Thermoanaerobaculia bacterium]